MDEIPKSIWKKSWKGWRGFLLGWLGLMLATLIIFWVIMFAAGARITSEELKLWAALAVCATTVTFLVLFFRWLFCWRNFKRFLFGLACFATLIALFFAEEDWRGKHDWEKFKHEWEAKGEKFDLKDFVPPASPDEQNFAFSPVWVAEIKNNFLSQPEKAQLWYGNRIFGEDVSNILPFFPISTTRSNDWNNNLTIGNWAKSTITDLEIWQTYYRNPAKKDSTNEFPITPQPQSPAADVLFALSKYDPVIEKLKIDSAMPHSRFPVQYGDDDPAEILLPHLAALKRYAQLLQLRAIAELQNGQSGKALDDIKLSLRLMDSIQAEPFIISHLVRFAIFQIILQPIYEGLTEHKWSDMQLAELDSELSKLDFLAGYELSVRGERAAHIKVIDYLEQKRIRYWDFFAMLGSDDGDRQKNVMNNFWVAAELYLMPKGWFYQNKIPLSQMHQQWNLPAVDDEQQMVLPKKIAQANKAVKSINGSTPFNFFARLLLPELGNFAQKTAFGQNAVNLARVAIALERYRLANGGYPDSLDALAPQFMEKIPHDVIGGKPLHYQRTDDGQFVLYSVGWNETDDGGVVVFKNGSAPRDEWKAGFDMNEGDWVWRYPQK